MATEAMERYCPICGKEATDPACNRFGEWACSESHAEDYAKEVRARKLSAMAPAPREERHRPRQGCCG